MSFGHSTPFGHTNQIHTRSSIGLLKIVLFVFVQASHALVIPLTQYFGLENDDVPAAEKELSIWLYLAIAAVLVLAGGAFAGLTIAWVNQESFDIANS